APAGDGPGLGSPGQQDQVAAGRKLPAKRDPGCLRPLLLRSCGGMKQDGIWPLRPISKFASLETKIGSAIGCIAQRQSSEPAVARDRMEGAGDLVAHIIKPGCRTLADTVRVVAVAATARESCYQRRFEKQTLGVDDLVILALAQNTNEFRNVRPGR